MCVSLGLLFAGGLGNEKSGGVSGHNFCRSFSFGSDTAHHGETNYDTDKLVSVKANVTSFLFINPHVQISLDTKNDKGRNREMDL